MLDRLPLELVQHIVFLTLPSSSSFTKYRERQDPLLALCSTSRSLREAVQPILFQAVKLESDKALNSFLQAVEANPALGEQVRLLRHAATPSLNGAEADLRPFARLCQRVVEIGVWEGHVHAAVLEAFPHLARLVVSHGSLSAAASFRLPHLRELSLVCSRFTSAQLFLPRSLPSLEAVHLQCSKSTDLLLEHFTTFGARLSALSCDYNDVMGVEMPPPPLLHPSMLFDCDTDSILTFADCPFATDIRALRFNPFAGSPFIDSAAISHEKLGHELLAWMTNFVDELSDPSLLPNLVAVHLPLAFGSRAFDELNSPAIMSDFEPLKQLCADRRVELVLEESLPHPYHDSYVSPEFVTRRKVAKAREEGQRMMDVEGV
ncbi:hypothetical protein JCM8097_002770 [Rhodosporidiobolus ruineniae]